jgi:hypothetical protein
VTKQPLTVLGAYDTLEEILDGTTRADILDELSRTGTAEDGLRRLRSAMSAHAFGTGSEVVGLERMVRKLDNRTRQDGFRVLHSWNHQTHEFMKDIVPVLMTDFYERAGPAEANDRLTLEILLDYYFLHILSLGAMRVWDEGDPDENIERISALVDLLQGPGGSGHHFIANAETLMIYALSQFHPDETAYDRFIDKVMGLSESHQVTFALVSVSVLSAHLRWGFWVMYERDVVRMRNDNVGDYPWLLIAIVTLMRHYAKLVEAGVGDEERESVVEGLLQGLGADPWAFTGKAPSSLSEYGPDYADLRDLLRRYGARLLDDFEAHRPSKEGYSPLALHFNFPHNTLVAILTIALLKGEPQALTMNDLFVPELSEVPGDETQESLARALMAFSGGSSERLGYHGAMLISYDHLTGLRSFTMTSNTIRKSLVSA